MQHTGHMIAYLILISLRGEGKIMMFPAFLVGKGEVWRFLFVTFFLFFSGNMEM